MACLPSILVKTLGEEVVGRVYLPWHSANRLFLPFFGSYFAECCYFTECIGKNTRQTNLFAECFHQDTMTRQSEKDWCNLDLYGIFTEYQNLTLGKARRQQPRRCCCNVTADVTRPPPCCPGPLDTLFCRVSNLVRGKVFAECILSDTQVKLCCVRSAECFFDTRQTPGFM